MNHKSHFINKKDLGIPNLLFSDITIYQRNDNKYATKIIKLEDNEELGLPELNVEYDNPKIWINNEIIQSY